MDFDRKDVSDYEIIRLIVKPLMLLKNYDSSDLDELLDIAKDICGKEETIELLKLQLPKLIK